MRRFRSRARSFRPRTNFSRARRIVRAVSGITLSKRVLLAGSTIPDVTSADWDNPLTIDLAEATETMDEEAESDGSTVADVPLYSRLTALKLNFQIVTGQLNIFRWMLYKKPDGEGLVTNLATQFHSSDDTATLREIRKYTIAKGFVIVKTDSLSARIPIFVSKAAMKRISPFREGDKLAFVIAKDAAGTTATLHGMGTLWFKANA